MRGPSDAFQNQLARIYCGEQALMAPMRYAGRVSMGTFRNNRHIRSADASRVVSRAGFDTRLHTVTIVCPWTIVTGRASSTTIGGAYSAHRPSAEPSLLPSRVWSPRIWPVLEADWFETLYHLRSRPP